MGHSLVHFISEKRPRQEAILSLASNFSSHEPRIFLQSCETNLEQKAWVWGYTITPTSQSQSCPLEAVSPTHWKPSTAVLVHCTLLERLLLLHYIPQYTTHTTRPALPYSQTHRCLPACVTRKAFWQNSNRVNMTANFSKSQTAPSIIWKLWGWVQCEGGGLAHCELQDELSKPTRQLHVGRSTV